MKKLYCKPNWQRQEEFRKHCTQSLIDHWHQASFHKPFFSANSVRNHTQHFAVTPRLLPYLLLVLSQWLYSNRVCWGQTDVRRPRSVPHRHESCPTAALFCYHVVPQRPLHFAQRKTRPWRIAKRSAEQRQQSTWILKLLTTRAGGFHKTTRAVCILINTVAYQMSLHWQWG